MDTQIEDFCPTDKADWRAWLEKQHDKQDAVWLIYYKKKSIRYNLSWSEAVDEALCFGWIDSTRRTLDEERFMQYFTPRKPKSTWSKINKDKVALLIQNNQMAPAGLKSIEIAKQNGSWSALDDVENLVMPDDLDLALNQHEGAMEFYQGQSKSMKKQLLYWVYSAKREATRKKRITEIAESATKGEKPKHFG